MSTEREYVKEPSFGVISIARVSSSQSQPLFGSSILHRSFIRLRIDGGVLSRDLSHGSGVYVYQNQTCTVTRTFSNTTIVALTTANMTYTVTVKGYVNVGIPFGGNITQTIATTTSTCDAETEP